VGLDRGVEQVLRFRRVGRLDFNEPPSVGLAKQDIALDQRIVREERRFEERSRTLVDRLTSGSEALDVEFIPRASWPFVTVREADQHATSELFAREHANLRALVEAVLQDLVRLQLARERFVHPPPEQLVTLFARGKAGFR
jgi:hypothetical protein